MAFLFEHATDAARMEKSTIDSSTRGRRKKIDENLYNQRSKNNFFQCFSLPQLSADVKRRKEKLYLSWKRECESFSSLPHGMCTRLKLWSVGGYNNYSIQEICYFYLSIGLDIPQKPSQHSLLSTHAKLFIWGNPKF